jgi:DNA processing protein
MPEQLLYQIALSMAPQIGAVTAKTLVRHCGDAAAVFRASRRELYRIPGIGPVVYNGLHTPGLLENAEKEARFIEQYGIDTLFFTDPRYPARLRQCHDSPALLFFKGSDPALLQQERIVALVGTRQPTDYGRALCEEFVEALQSWNVLIVSGLAYGIDITAHRQACSIQMPNIGVLGHGLGSIYPAQHRSTALKMCENGGLLSEYISDTKPDREHFPMRNRIIAGLCDALLVVETASIGGSMISAELARQYGRNVFAVPGRVRDPKSAGCNLLIKNDMAQLVESAEELALAMGWQSGASTRPVQTQLFLDLPPAQTRILELVRAQPEIAIDELGFGVGLSPGELAAQILQLEFLGLIRTLPGKRYTTI